jgi:serine/threonine-protein kinase
MECPACHTAVEGSSRFCPTCGISLGKPTVPDAPRADPLLGQVLGGKYRIVRLLGEGGMGAVYEGEQQLGTTKRRVAVKTLHPHLSRNPQIEARFQREVGTIAELEHPHTIQVYDFGTTPEGILYIVMEFLQGKSLADLLSAQGAMSPERVAHILEQVCGSLEEAHLHGIVHRDLKPDNVVLVERAGQKDYVKVLDFGIAKRSREEDKNEQKLTQQGMVLGTPPYMSPEQFTGQPIDARSDIYSLGVMAYEMLSGKLPFNATTAWEWATQHMTQSPIPIESLEQGNRVPQAMRDALARALAKSPDERFQTVKAFIEAFEGKTPTDTAPMAGGRPAQKTELGAPLDVAAAFGARAEAPPEPHPPGYTPAAGNMAFPTGASPARVVVPAPPPPSNRGQGNRTPLLVAAGVIGVASVVAIAFALRGAHRGGRDVVFDTGSSAPAATTIAPAAPADSGSAAETKPSDIPPLAGGQTPSKRPPGGAAPGGAAGAHSASAPSARPEPSSFPGIPSGISLPSGFPPFPQPQQAAPSATQPAPAQPAPTLQVPPQPGSPSTAPVPQTTPQGKYDGIECQRARQFRALGRTREAQSWAEACIRRGGTP